MTLSDFVLRRRRGEWICPACYQSHQSQEASDDCCRGADCCEVTDAVPAMNAGPDGSVTGYMCLTDWECEIGAASGGERVYPSIDDLLWHRRCAKSCGIVEVSVSFKRIVAPPVEN